MPSFGEELGRLIPQMRRFARALVRGHSARTADDLVQETIVLAMRAERMARGPLLRSWCFGCLMRVHRQWESSTRMSSPQRGGDTASPPAGPVAFMPKDIVGLDLLPLESREVLLLTVLVGMSYAQSAEALHVTTETVLARLDLARALLGRGQRPVSAASSAGTASARSGRAAQYLHVVK